MYVYIRKFSPRRKTSELHAFTVFPTFFILWHFTKNCICKTHGSKLLRSLKGGQHYQHNNWEAQSQRALQNTAKNL